LLVVRHSERPVRDVLSDHRTGASVCVIADGHRGDQRGIDRDPRTFPDLRLVLVAAVVVGRDRPGADVRTRPDLGVADVRQMGHLRALADGRLLDLDEAARLGAAGQPGLGAQVGVGADGAVVVDLRLDHVGVQDADAGADAGVDHGRMGPDDRIGPNPGAPAQRGPGLDRRVGLDLDVGVDPGRGRVDDGDAGEHVAVQDLAAGLGRDLGEVGAVVDAEVDVRVVGAVGDDPQTLLAQHRQHVAEVVLAGGVVVAERVERLDERGGGEDVGADVDLLDRQDVRIDLVGLLGLDDRLDVTLLVADDASVGAGVVELDGHHRRPRVGVPMGRDQPLDDLGADQWMVAGEHDHGLGVADQVVRGAHSASGAVGFGLDHRLGALGQAGGQVSVGRDDHGHTPGPGLARGQHGPSDHRTAGHVVQDLGQRGAHARSLARGHDQDGGAAAGPVRSAAHPRNRRAIGELLSLCEKNPLFGRGFAA
jgi:hypothetical protein